MGFCRKCIEKCIEKCTDCVNEVLFTIEEVIYDGIYYVDRKLFGERGYYHGVHPGSIPRKDKEFYNTPHKTLDFSFRTWELAYVKEVSRVVDEIIPDEPKSDVIKRLVRSFLPRFPDECRMNAGDFSDYAHDWHDSGRVAAVEWYANDGDETYRIHASGYSSIPGREGDSIWVFYYPPNETPNFNSLRDIFRDGSKTGIARVERLKNTRIDEGGDRTARVRIRDLIPFERFYEYFDYESIPNWVYKKGGYTKEDWVEGVEKLNQPLYASSMRRLFTEPVLWDGRGWGPDLPPLERQDYTCQVFRDTATVGIDVFETSGVNWFEEIGEPKYIMRRIYKQRNGTWVYAFKMGFIHTFYFSLPEVTLAVLSEERLEEILATYENDDILGQGIIVQE